MDAIIELFQKYFYIIGVVGYFIFKMFLSKEEKKPTAMPPFGGGNTQSDDDDEYEQEYYEEPPRQQPAPVPMTTANTAPSQFGSQHTTATSEFDSIKLEAARKRLYESKQIKANNAKASTANQQKVSAVQPGILEADDIRKAVIWSEILGQPRARKPFRR